MVTYDLTAMRDLNLMYMHELNFAENRARQTIIGESDIFYFDWNVEKKWVKPDRLETTVSLKIPYANIWFKEEYEKLATKLEAYKELRNGKKNG